jgi:hypothetical protein
MGGVLQSNAGSDVSCYSHYTGGAGNILKDSLAASQYRHNIEEYLGAL